MTQDVNCSNFGVVLDFFKKRIWVFSFLFGIAIGSGLSFIAYKFIFFETFACRDYLRKDGSGSVRYFKNNNFSRKIIKKPVFNKPARAVGEVVLMSGENLFTALLRENFNREEVNAIIGVLSGKVDLKNLIERQRFEVYYNFTIAYEKREQDKKKKGAFSTKQDFKPERKFAVEKRNITSLSFKLRNGNKYKVEKIGNTFRLHIEKPKIITKTHIVSGVIYNGLFQDALIGDIKPSTLYNMLNEYAFLVDFQRDLHKGDKFIFVLDTTKDSDGDVIDEKILYSNLILQGRNHEIFNFNGRYYDRKGQSVQRMLLKTPVDGARVSSKFNPRRKHPILGYTKAHTGIDLAVPMGTPIYASGDGVVKEVVLDHRAYGKYVTIQHNREYATRYAHMSKVANLKKGQKVRQRQVIGYVGMTGLATGPHLHYEVIRHGVHINPSRMQISSVKHIDKNKINQFNDVVKNIDFLLSKK